MILAFARYRGAPPFFVQVDEEDAPRILLHQWHLDTAGYAAGYVNGRLVTMHRLVLCMPRSARGVRGDPIDHINGDKLDNRKANLRIGASTNRLNSRARFDSSTGITGVGRRRDGRWFANWKIAGKRTFKFFDTKEEAAACRMAFNSEHKLTNTMRCAGMA